jgi:hypothetical protein
VAASTLALGSSGYNLTEVDTDSFLGGTPPSGIRASQRGRGPDYSTSVRASRSSENIDALGIGDDGQINSSVSLSAFTTDLQVSLGSGNDELIISRDADDAIILMDEIGDNGNDLISISADLTNSTAALGGGDDTVRITGTADGTTFDLGAGRDSLVVTGDSSDVNLTGGDDADFIQFRGQLEFSGIDAGAGDDKVILANGLYGSIDEQITDSWVDLGDGDDTLVMRAIAEGFNINASDAEGRDEINLEGQYYASSVWLGGGDRILVDSDFSEGRIASDSEIGLGDTVVFGVDSYVSNFDGGFEGWAVALGDGDDSVVFGGVFDSSNVYLGAGDDTVVFGSASQFFDGTLDLGSGSDEIYFRSSLGDLDVDGRFAGFRITNAGDDDTLYVGDGSYTAFYYNSTDDQWENTSDTLRFG